MKKKVFMTMFLSLIGIMLFGLSGTVSAQTCGSCGKSVTIKTHEGVRYPDTSCQYYKCSSCSYTDGWSHKWTVTTTAATCTTAETTSYSCSRNISYHQYSVTSGSALGHNYGSWYTVTSATCTSAGTKRRDCTRSGCSSYETGTISALGHSWSSATCTSPATCTRSGCSATNGSALGHSYSDATCTTAATCSRCGAIKGSALGHNYSAATCTAAATCTRCGVTNGSALGHDYSAATCTAAATCSRCGVTSGSALGHSYSAATCTKAATCSRCGATKGSALGHSYTVACSTCGTANVVCSTCGNSKDHTCLQAPSVTIKYPDGTNYGEAWTNKNIVITLNATDATGYEYSTNGTTWSTHSSLSMNGTTGTMTFSSNINGTVYFRAINSGGSSGRTSAYTMKIDKTAPTAGTMLMKLGSSTGSTYTSGAKTTENVYIEVVNGSDALSGHKSTTYQVTGANIVAAGTTKATTLTNSGTSTITVTTTDNAGNTATRTYSVVIETASVATDTLAPTGAITLGGTYYEANGYKYVKSGVVTLNLTAADNESEQENIKVALINEANYDKTKQNSTITWLDFSATKQWTSSSGKGLKRVYVIFKDEAGNQSVYFAQ